MNRERKAGAIATDDIQRLLDDAGFPGPWHVTAPAHGSTDRAFVARCGNQVVFVKLGLVHPSLGRLADLGVTPPIIGQGEHHGEPFTIFQYMEGVVPDRIWMRDNAGHVLDLLGIVQRDGPLAHLLSTAAPVPTLGEHLAAVVARLTERTTRASAPAFRSSEIEPSLQRVRTAHHAVDGVPLVPSHTDPSPPNVLVMPGRMYLVDWDDIRLSDPMRDIGLILWWFVPPERWEMMLRRFWLPDAASAAMIDRIYWWAAVSSFRVALWIDRQAPDDDAVRSFLDDFHEAAARRPNPKRVA